MGFLDLRRLSQEVKASQAIVMHPHGVGLSPASVDGPRQLGAVQAGIDEVKQPARVLFVTCPRVKDSRGNPPILERLGGKSR